MHLGIRFVGLAGLWTACCAGAIGAASCVDAPAPLPKPAEHVGEVAQAIGVCDATPESAQACVQAVSNVNGVVHDIFRDANGLTGLELPILGQLFNNWPGCTTTNSACACGRSNPPYDCPGQYCCSTTSLDQGVACTTAASPPAFSTVAGCVNALDRLWGHPYRLTDHTLIGACPNWLGRVANGQAGNYYPWEGLVFDLGGPSNKVAIFAENDHGPQPCESLEYTVYLTDNPFSQERIQYPATDGVNPDKWNRAVLVQMFTKGWVEVRPPDPVGHATCGDTSDFSVEEDSFVQVFSLPCGITFRYAAIIGGNDGLDFPECEYPSDEAELDAVAGLTESNSGVCPDDDGDLYVDCECITAPELCDCNDDDETIHPGAAEPCDSVDVDCDGLPGDCEEDLVCYQHMCVQSCDNELVICPPGSTCNEALGNICVPEACTGDDCPIGTTCSDGLCVPSCDDLVCPGEHVCVDGKCLDPCRDIDCPPPTVCQNAQCVVPCACFEGNTGCAELPGTVCDTNNTELCVAPTCVGVVCDASQHCDPDIGWCVDFCNDDVVCPQGDKCVDPEGCVPICFDVVCEGGLECNPQTGECEDFGCVDLTCFPPLVCEYGECVEGPGGEGGAGGGGPAGGAGAVGGGTGLSVSGTPATPEEEGGCGCRVGGRGASTLGALAWSLSALLGAGLGRRARRPRRRV